MTPVRILRIIARMNVGGPALQVTGLTERLHDDEFETLLVAGFVEDDEQDFVDLRAPDLPLRQIEGLGRSIRFSDDLRSLGEIVKLVRAYQPHIVHTHTAKAGVLGRLTARFLGVPYVVHTFHGHLLHGYFSRPLTAGVRATERALARVSTRLFTVGSQVRDDLLDAGIGDRDQYVVMPPGVTVPEPPAEAAARKKLGIPQEGSVICFVARLTSVKRPDRFIEAARYLVERHPDLTVVVAGEGDLLGQMIEQARPLGRNIRFLGWRSDVETIYGASDIVMLASDNEGMPVSLIEAAMCGVPAVTTGVGSASEVVIDGETGFLVKSDAQALADAASKVLASSQLRSEMAAAARRYAHQAFSMDRLVTDTRTAYRAMMGRDSRSA